MSKRQPRFEIVRTDAGWHARYKSANGEKVWTTEANGYRKERTAIAAIESFTGYEVTVQPNTENLEVYKWDIKLGLVLLEVRRVDERSAVTA